MEAFYPKSQFSKQDFGLQVCPIILASFKNKNTTHYTHFTEYSFINQ